MKQGVQVCIGQRAQLVGRMAHVKEGAREYSVFKYDASWLTATERFEISPAYAR